MYSKVFYQFPNYNVREKIAQLFAQLHNCPIAQLLPNCPIIAQIIAELAKHYLD